MSLHLLDFADSHKVSRLQPPGFVLCLATCAGCWQTGSGEMQQVLPDTSDQQPSVWGLLLLLSCVTFHKPWRFGVSQLLGHRALSIRAEWLESPLSKTLPGEQHTKAQDGSFCSPTYRESQPWVRWCVLLPADIKVFLCVFFCFIEEINLERIDLGLKTLCLIASSWSWTSRWD